MILKPNTNINIATDIRNAFAILIKKPMLYHITISQTKPKHAADLRHKLTNGVFNALNKQYKCLNFFLDYLFVIEYEGILSKDISFKNHKEFSGRGEHAHIVISTSIPQRNIENKIKEVFNSKYDCLIENISNRDDKENLVNYLLKQETILSKENYNYKISLDKQPIKTICLV